MTEVVAGFLLPLMDRFLQVLLAPIEYQDMLWIAVPLVLTIFLTELYFSRYKTEELGWNSAYGNTLVLIFVTVDLFRFLYNHNQLDQMSIHLALACAVGIIAIMLTLTNFLHLLPEDFAYGISSKLPLNFVAYIVLVLVYSGIPVDMFTIISAALIFALLGALVVLIRRCIPTFVEEISY